MTYKIAFDFGGSTTKLLVARAHTITQRVITPPFARPDAATLRALITQAELDLRDVSAIFVTGGHSRHLPATLDGTPLTHVGEAEAIGRGGLRAANVPEALVVSLGTGTAMVLARGTKTTHLGGSAVGGGTLIGLGQLLLGTDDPRSLADLAVQGDLTRVDLTVGDIIGSGIGRVPADFAAAHFGKIARAATPPTRADIAAGLCNLIGQAIATTILPTATVCQQSVVVLTGNLINVAAVRAALEAVDRLGAGERFRVPPYPGFATALGAFEIAPQ
jgi:type II pantothenate kinase